MGVLMWQCLRRSLFGHSPHSYRLLTALSNLKGILRVWRSFTIFGREIGHSSFLISTFIIGAEAAHRLSCGARPAVVSALFSLMQANTEGVAGSYLSRSRSHPIPRFYCCSHELGFTEQKKVAHIAVWGC